MTTGTIAIPGYDVHLLLHDVSWEAYDQLLQKLDAQHRHLRLTYDEGTLEIMSPSDPHERWKKRIARLVELMAFELKIEIECLGQTTFRRKIRRKGLEPDECYYVQNAATVRQVEIDLSIHPPPDLVVESDYSNSSLPREPVYAGLGMPELWRFDGETLTIRRLGADGRYHNAKKSPAFPFLPMKQFTMFLHRLDKERSTVVLSDFQEWVRTLKL